MNTLIAYFSYTGHTKGIARQIQELTGGTLFEIKPATPYSDDYDTTERQGRKPKTGIVRNWRKSQQNWLPTIRSCWEHRTGLIRLLRLWSPFWQTVICLAKRLRCSVPTVAVDLGIL